MSQSEKCRFSSVGRPEYLNLNQDEMLMFKYLRKPKLMRCIPCTTLAEAQHLFDTLVTPNIVGFAWYVAPNDPSLIIEFSA